jgi:predicted RNA-binding Zn-ribbon protein involved in translation (DUF1610 family)
MGSFTCTCGYVTKDSNGITSAYYIALSLDEAVDLEKRIAEKITSYLAEKQSGKKAEWLTEFYGNAYLLNEPDSSIIEDITTAEMNRNFHTIFRCPNCGRIHLNSKQDSNLWQTYKPDGTCGTR